MWNIRIEISPTKMHKHLDVLINPKALGPTSRPSTRGMFEEDVLPLKLQYLQKVPHGGKGCVDACEAFASQ